MPTAFLPTATSLPASTPTTAPEAWVEAQLKLMTLEQKAGQVIMTGVIGSDPSASNCKTMQSLQPGGVVYIGSNVISLEGLKQLSASLQQCNQDSRGLPLLIALDHEGQFIDRFQSGATVFPAALAIGATQDPRNAFKMANTSGQELVYAGVNMALGPDADVLTNPENSVISVRSYGSDADQVSKYVIQAAQGYRQAGMIAVIKHFPGHGGTTADSHTNLPVDNSSLAKMQKTQLVPFQAAIQAGADVVMVGHIAYPAIDPSGLPASLSKPAIDLLRNSLGFQGLVISDELSMGAITQNGRTAAAAAIQGLKAGLDMVMITAPAQASDARDQLVSAVHMGTFSPSRLDDAVRHILRVKAVYGLRAYPLPAQARPDTAANQQISAAIGQAAVAAPMNSAGLAPIPGDKRRILVIGPVESIVSAGFYSSLEQTLRARQYQPSFIKYTLNSLTNKDVTASASTYDLVIFLTWDAHINRDAWQLQSVRSLMASGKPLIVAALKSPFDVLDFPGVSTYLATLGTTQGQAQQLADVLAGNRTATGRLPVQVLK